MKLNDLGERKLIKEIMSILGKGQVAVGPGDDCAAIEFGDQFILITTDMITKSTHLHESITPYQIGWFIIAINLSDIAAKGGIPLGLVVSVGLPEDLVLEFLTEMTNGMNDCALEFSTSVIGGDMKANPEITLSGTAIGKVAKTEFMGRYGCHQGDLVAVTGNLGAAAAGYYALTNSLDRSEYTDGIKALFEPYPRINEGRTLARSGAITSSMDISDGLAASLYQLSELNEVGFEIEFDKVPKSPDAVKISEQLGIPIPDLSLYFGGDYELVVTLNPELSDKAIDILEKETGTRLTVIGKVTDTKNNTLIINNEIRELENRGYEHFTRQ
jgi:thiamine-monophosphate kinase